MSKAEPKNPIAPVRMPATYYSKSKMVGNNLALYFRIQPTNPGGNPIFNLAGSKWRFRGKRRATNNPKDYRPDGSHVSGQCISTDRDIYGT